MNYRTETFVSSKPTTPVRLAMFDRNLVDHGTVVLAGHRSKRVDVFRTVVGTLVPADTRTVAEIGRAARDNMRAGVR